MLPNVMTHGAANMLCPLALRHLQPRLFPPSVILADSNLAGSDPCPLSCYRPLVATFALLETHTLLALSTLLWTSLAIQQSTSLPSCLLGKNIFRVILLEW